MFIINFHILTCICWFCHHILFPSFRHINCLHAVRLWWILHNCCSVSLASQKSTRTVFFVTGNNSRLYTQSTQSKWFLLCHVCYLNTPRNDTIAGLAYWVSDHFNPCACGMLRVWQEECTQHGFYLDQVWTNSCSCCNECGMIYKRFVL
jgi:hypothetical protein